MLSLNTNMRHSLLRKPTVSLFAFVITTGVMAPGAFAAHDCTEAKPLLNVIKTFYEVDPKYSNIIQPRFRLTLTPIGDNPQPDGVRYVHEGEKIDLPVAEDGEVLELEKALTFHKNGKLCKLVNGDFVEEQEEPSGEASMSFTFPFKNTSGVHSVDDLLEGAKDGSKVMNRLAPGGLGFVVPGLKAIVIRPDNSDDAAPVVSFWRDNQKIDGPPLSRLGKSQFFRTKDLKRSKADEVRIDGTYKMDANFDYKEEDLAKAEAARLKALEVEETQ